MKNKIHYKSLNKTRSDTQKNILKQIIMTISFLLMPFGVFAQWNDCTHGRIDDACAAPGECGRYVDTNNDKICDHSQPEPVAKADAVKNDTEAVVSAVTNSEEEDVAKSMEAQKSTEDTRPEVENNGERVGASSQIEDQKVLLGIKKENHKQRYPFLQIVIGSTVLYLLTYLLAKKNIMRMITHKKIWNIFLTISFLLMALTSIILVIQINSGRRFFPSFDLIYWHVVTGSVMLIITLFHMGWHWRYYKNLFK